MKLGDSIHYAISGLETVEGYYGTGVIIRFWKLKTYKYNRKSQKRYIRYDPTIEWIDISLNNGTQSRWVRPSEITLDKQQ